MSRYVSYNPCVACGIDHTEGNEFHHVRTRGAGGGDEAFNMMTLCHRDHTLVHNIGLITFSKRFPKVHDWLTSHDWAISELTHKWTHYQSTSKEDTYGESCKEGSQETCQEAREEEVGTKSGDENYPLRYTRKIDQKRFLARRLSRQEYMFFDPDNGSKIPLSAYVVRHNYIADPGNVKPKSNQRLNFKRRRINKL